MKTERKKAVAPATLPTIEQLIAQRALFVVNHSGGKDSQAMLIDLMTRIPHDLMIVVHSDLGAMEWHGAKEIAAKHAADCGLPFIVARSFDINGNERNLLDLVAAKFESRPEVPSWPSPDCRSCTSALKRDPTMREVRRYAKQHGFTQVVNCEGIRAQESADRAKRPSFEFVARGSSQTRTWFNWAPIHAMTTDQVFASIRAAGVELHPAYAAGNERLSCVFCIMGSKNDLLLGSIARPELFAAYVAMEQRTGYTMHMDRKPLTQLVAEAAAEAKRAA